MEQRLLSNKLKDEALNNVLDKTTSSSLNLPADVGQEAFHNKIHHTKAEESNDGVFNWETDSFESD